jgi:hypothetical protein
MWATCSMRWRWVAMAIWWPSLTLLLGSTAGCEARGKKRREAIWFRDADVAEAVDAVLFVGLADWYPPNYDCGDCGYVTCAEFLHATKPRRDDSHFLEFGGLPQPARHRLGHRRRFGGQDGHHPLHRLRLPDPHRRRRRAGSTSSTPG